MMYCPAHGEVLPCRQCLSNLQTKSGPPWCCEKGEAANVKVCPECDSASVGYSAAAGVTGTSPGSHIVPTTVPMFASGVARRKWESLQSDGYRMQRIHFARSVDGHERRGSIDPWGKVLWEPDGVEGTSK